MMNTFHNPTFLERVAEHMVQNFGDNFQNVAVVFNNQRPAQYLNHALAKKLNKVFWSPQYFTIQDFVARGSDKMEMNSITQAFHLLEVYFEAVREEKNYTLEDYSELMPLAELILQDFAQIDYELVSVSEIFQYLIELGEIDRKFDYLTEEQKEYLKRFWSSFSDNRQTEIQDKFLNIWRKMPLIYEGFHQKLEKEGYSTIPKTYRNLAENQQLIESHLNDFKAVLFVGFNALNACEKRLFKEWQKLGKALFYFDVDEHYFYDKFQEAGLFIRENIGNLGLKNALGDPISVLNNLNHPIQVIQSPGHTVQAKVIKNLIEDQWFEKEGSKAIILADETLLLPLIQSLPKTISREGRVQNLKYNITMGFPIRESNSYGLFSLYLEIQTHFQKQNIKRFKTVPQSLLMDFVVHPYVNFSDEIKNGLISKISLFSREEILLDEVRKLFESVDLKNEKGADLALKIFHRPKTISEFLGNLESIWVHNYTLDLSGDSEESLEKSLSENALQAIDQLGEIFKKFEEISINVAIRIVKRQIQQISTPLKGDPIEDIQIMGMLESRNLHFDHVILLGMNEGVIPVARNPHSLIPYTIRRAFSLPVLENQNGLSAYLFYRLLHVNPEILIVYNHLISENSSGELSRFIHQLEFETSAKVLYRNVQLGSQSVSEKSDSPKEKVQTLPPIEKKGEVWEKLKEFLNNGGRRLSASAFTAYLQSPYYFFIKYIAGIKEEPQISKGLEKNVVGTLVHKIMELYYEPYLKSQKQIIKEDFKDLKNKVDLLARQAFIEINLNEPQSARDDLSIEISKKYAYEFLSYDAKTYSGFQIKELENEDDYNYNFPISILGDEHFVRLRGIIDRVDFRDGSYHIVDYKTGSDKLMFVAHTSEEDIRFHFFDDFSFKEEYKAFIQTFFYTLIYQKITGRENVTPHVYNLQFLKQGRSQFYFKKSRVEEYFTVDLEMSKSMIVSFENYLKSKLEELFNPEVPFIHPQDHQVYMYSPYVVFLAENVMDDDEESY